MKPLEEPVDQDQEQEQPTATVVRTGCGNGGLRWEDVKPDIAPILKGDDYIIVERP